jgi:predicted metal-binding membrane protein
VPPEPSATAIPPSAIEPLIARDRTVTGIALVAIVGLAWWWLFAHPMAGSASSYGMAAMAATPAPWSPSYLLATFVMWALMMVAMMLPSAAPMILLFGRFVRRSGAGAAVARTGLFALSYVAVWALFSAAAALLQTALVSTGMVSAMALAVNGRWASAGLLLLIAAYQLSPLKQACLAQCRSPMDFLMRLWRPGIAGSVRLGIVHGAYCVGCCWALMLLLFIGGVMNLTWIALVAAIVLVEKLAPPGERIRTIIAAVLVGAAIALAAGA